MIRSAVICLFLAAAILPELAVAQNSDWNNTTLDDGVLIGVIVAAAVSFFLIVVIIAVCCCCFMCPQLFGGMACCGNPDYPQEPPYFEPPPPQYYPSQPEPEPYPLVVSRPRPSPEPVYIVKPERSGRETQRNVYIVRDRDEPRDERSYHQDNVVRRVIIQSPPFARYDRDYDRDYDYPRRNDYRSYRSTSPTRLRNDSYY